jgi:hypothetical protein
MRARLGPEFALTAIEQATQARAYQPRVIGRISFAAR